MTIKEAKADYNKMLKRFEKANEYFDNANISEAQKEIQLPNFMEVLKGLNYCLSIIEVYTNQEVMKGF